jgi:hypothetical protein
MLAPHVRTERASTPRTAWRVSAGDVKDFLLAYCACFMAVSAFIA